MTLPLLMSTDYHSLNVDAIHSIEQQIPVATQRVKLMILDRPQPESFFLAARDEETEECSWLGTCSERF